jgi:lysine 2,3-aminomutase
LKYIETHKEIRDVLVTGGDALSLSDDELEFIISNLRNMTHIEIIRIGTRMLVNLPQRITEKLSELLSKYHPIYINTQFNHPIELTKESKKALKILADNGIILGNQMVLLNGINNNKYIVRRLNEMLLAERVRPYYIFHAKPVQGTDHFQTSVAEGIEILEYLRGNTSGLAIPTYVFNAPNGLGKIPLNPNYLLSDNGNELIFRTWENKQVSWFL